ncbi:MAG TPA: hypothetical protein VGF93_17410 [Solirubrobacteraceae bacterium]
MTQGIRKCAATVVFAVAFASMLAGCGSGGSGTVAPQAKEAATPPPPTAAA